MAPRCGLLLSNLGTPDAPTASALRRYLREFLGDPRVVEVPRVVWTVILEAFILPFRPAKSATLYAKIWTPEGSPLLAGTRALAAAVATRLPEMTVAVGMRYGRPSIEQALDELAAAGCERVVVVPLYPQYSATTTASTLDAVGAVLRRRRVVPHLHFVRDYFREPAWVDAVAASLEAAWKERPPAEKLVFSFHGLPKRYVDAGDPYADQCRASASALAARLKLPDDRWVATFQSRFGREEWLRPYTDETLEALARGGVASVDVACPGFAVDCLETLEEIAMLNRGIFLGAGGREYRYVPCLNASDAAADLVAAIARREVAGRP